jgi:hypothetical protein
MTEETVSATITISASAETVFSVLADPKTKVTFSYDWSAVGPIPRQHIHFPPFTPDHLDNSLSHLAAIVAR